MSANHKMGTYENKLPSKDGSLQTNLYASIILSTDSPDAFTKAVVLYNLLIVYSRFLRIMSKPTFKRILENRTA